MATFLAASMFIQTLYVLADLYWIGWLGNEAIAAVASPAGIASILMLLLMMIVQFAGGGLIRAFSRDPAVITFGSDYFKIVSFNFVAVELVFISSSVFQGIGKRSATACQLNDASAPLCFAGNSVVAQAGISNPVCMISVCSFDFLSGLRQSCPATARVSTKINLSRNTRPDPRRRAPFNRLILLQLSKYAATSWVNVDR
jgi:hypothetical protein